MVKNRLTPDGDPLLDSHILYWLVSDPTRVPKRVRDAIEQARHRFVSHVTALEIQLKNTKNPKAFSFGLKDLDEAMKAFSCQELPITYRDIQMLGELQFVHPDPFDRLLIAQAVNRSLCLVTHDASILRTAHLYRAFEVLPVP